MRVLLVEDEVPLARALRQGLEEEAMVVDTAHDGEEGLWAASGDEYDVVVLDLNLPKLPGLDVCRALRDRGVRARILMLTAADSTASVVRGLGAGADDYVRKPVAFEEFLARVRALARSPRRSREEVLRAGTVTVNTAARTVREGDRLVDLTAAEYRLLEYLCVHAGETVPRDRLTAALWERDCEPESNVLEVLASSIRRKIPSLRGALVAVRGCGYRFVAPVPS